MQRSKPSSARSPRAALAVRQVVVWAVLAGALGVQAQAPPGDFLLRVADSRWMSDGSWVVDKLLIFHDGLVLLERTLDDGSTEVTRARAPAAELVSIKVMLAVQQVGQQQGRCAVEGIGTPLARDQTPEARGTVLSWFGKGNRARHLVLAHSDAPMESDLATPCGAPVQEIAWQVLSFVARTLEAAEEDPGFSLLIEVRNSMQEDPDCGEGGFSDDWLSFRDGLILRRVRDSEGFYRFVRAAANPEALGRLKQVLSEVEIGFLSGSCRISFFLPFLVSSDCLGFTWQSGATWHGAGERTSTIFGTNEIENTCSDVRQRFRAELSGFLRNTLGQPSNQEVSGRLP